MTLDTSFEDQTLNKKLKKWCDSLLDLSRRNPSLHFATHAKTGRKKPSVFQIDLNIDSLFNELVLEGKALPLSSLNFKDEDKNDDDEFNSLFNSNNLQKKIIRLKRDVENILEERGTHVLYITLGSYKWKEEKIADDFLNTPVFLVPVNIVKSKTRDKFSVQIADIGDVEFNPTFSYILKKLYNIDFEGLLAGLENNTESEFKFSDKLALIEEQLNKVTNGHLVKDVWLSKFWFEKLVLFNDLQRNLDLFLLSKNIRNICGQYEIQDLNIPYEMEMLSKFANSRNALEVYEVLDSDSSQRVAIEAAINNKNFILIGPPGTGKSQTITNIISECLARDKKVLFVSEKLAALKVVERKLSEANLVKFVLSLHGKDVKKKDFYSDLLSWYEMLAGRVFSSDDSSRVIYEDLNEVSKKLSDYIEALSSRNPNLPKAIKNSQADVQSLDMTAQYIQSRMIELNLNKTPDIKSKINIDNLDPYKFKNQLDVLERSVAFKDFITKEVTSDWFFTTLEGPLTKELIEKMNLDLKSLKFIRSVKQSVQSVAALLGMNPQIKFGQIQDLIFLSLMTLSNRQIDPSLLNYESFKELLRDYEKDKKLHDKYAEEKQSISKYFREEILDQDIFKLKSDFTDNFEGDSLRFVKLSYWKARKNILRYKSRSLNVAWINDEIIYEQLDRCFKAKELHEQILNQSESFKNKYSIYYRNIDTNWDEIGSMIKDLKNIFESLLFMGMPINKLPENLIFLLSKSNSSEKDALRAELAELLEALDLFHSGFLNLNKYFDILLNCGEVSDKGISVRCEYSFAQINLNEKNIDDVCAWADRLEYDLNHRTSIIERWFYFKSLKEKLINLDVWNFVCDFYGFYIDDSFSILEVFEKRVLELIYMKLENEHPSLAAFDKGEIERSISDFKRLDKQVIKLNRDRIFYDLASKIRNSIADDNSKEIKLIKKLGNQKHPRMPIRKVVLGAINFLLKLKPCWMMSPISVCQYLPAVPDLFDVVVFDEASQVRPADAIGAILRGKQVIVVGDPRQLPPTNFFQKITQGEDEVSNDVFEEGIEESIIDEIKSKATGFIEIPLRWHYRSKSEDLFAFVNKYIYDDLKLITFPNPTDITSDGKELGVRHILVDGIYDRGVSRTNQVEADKVADLVVEHFANNTTDKTSPNFLSLGVIAFSSAQEKAIVDSLFRKKRDFPFLESVLDDREGESFFVKNLETVQGDERDHIIISVGYGPDKDGKMSNNFGPVNQEGGERRLNVAITRARRNLLLVSSFTHKDIQLNSAQKGAQLLLKYIQYSIEGKNSLNDENITDTTLEFKSLFDQLVFKKLIEHGVPVKPNLGTSDCKVNLAIENPFQRGNYLFAVETDGEAYYNVVSNRDRERLKGEILSDRGWKIYRIWSKDWLKNYEKELKSLFDLYQQHVSFEEQKYASNKLYDVVEYDQTLFDQ